ncbi:hypothetical protein SEUCBS139899_001070 [Sporothrix eucalyptigena]|uniref:Chromosome transmission fidelity protein 8 n=1 Tax=Sporothrix eucalyptigena TaxID=1812306 RepID=A0ABP0B5X0_9PEZI
MDDSSTVTIHPRKEDSARTIPNPLPTLLQTPAGLALLELQGTINLPEAPEGRSDDDDNNMTDTAKASHTVPIGRLDFPDYDPITGAESTGWMRRVHLYVGQHQRLTGEVKKLPKPLAVVRRKQQGPTQEASDETDLEVVEVIYYKLLFSQRPEPMTESSF